jgi:carbonic anhydrase
MPVKRVRIAGLSAADDLLRANALYASYFTKGDLPAPPARRFAVVTCMDARLDPAKALFLEEGDAHVIRNAGGLVTDDVLRSLAISHWELGTQEVVVIGHTRCGLLTLDQRELRAKIGDAASRMDFLPFGDLDASVRESVRRVRESPLLPDSFGASGMVYDVETGRLRRVEE